MPQQQTLTERAQELVETYRSLARDLDVEDAAQASQVVGQMLVHVERANRVQSDVAVRVAEEAIAAATRLFGELHPRH